MQPQAPSQPPPPPTEDAFYIHSGPTHVDDRTRVLKHADTFAVFDRRGDVHPYGRGHHGLYHRGTRHLSRLELLIDGEPLLLLSSTIKSDNTHLAVDLANPDLARGRPQPLPADKLHLFRSTFLYRGTCHLRLRLRNFGDRAVAVALTLRFAADFRDIFEVRGMQRPARGELLEPELGPTHALLRYRGRDGRLRGTRIDCEPAPDRVSADALTLHCRLEARQACSWQLRIRCLADDEAPVELGYDAALQQVTQRLHELRAAAASFTTAHEGCNDWLERSTADLHMMLTELPEGQYPYAGVPWFSTVFGRDGIITALQCLLVEPAIARGVLLHLAATQATATDKDRDAEPGKILHEARDGEMAALREIPFGRYYGTVDATPLFVMLAGAYWRRTGDLGFQRRLWPHVDAALQWIDAEVAKTKDGFVGYHRQGADGLVNQGWKDSGDSVSHADGSLAPGPIALCEVQAYVYGAWIDAAAIAGRLGLGERAERLRQAAARLRRDFDRAYWLDDLGTYALALDGQRRPCRVRASNAGHALLTGLALPERAEALAATLLADDCWSGWGIRTLATGELRYNPMSYHNGSVWPHDNALIALGLSRYGLQAAAQQLFAGMLDASQVLEVHRLPELFCGFPRRPGEGPTLYPVACAPQAWAVAAVYALLEACLGLCADGVRRQLVVDHPTLPGPLEWVALRQLRIGDAVADVTFHRRGNGVGIEVERAHGDLQVRIRQ